MNDKVKAAVAAKRTMVTGVLCGVALVTYGLWISRGHITHIGYAIGLDAFEAETLFLLVDFLYLYGKMLASKRLSAKTRRIGGKFMIAGGAASLACNVASGVLSGSIGKSAYGAVLVGIIAALEYAIANTKAKTVVKQQARAATAAPLTPRQLAARKGAETRRRNALAPVSPGVGPVGTYAGRKA